ncbi:hypothetical protein GQ43DRAFT_343948, partial [Delitschia confertaspora ATCC 74209]
MSVARRAASPLLAATSVHIRIQPRPADLSESRQILRVLQRFGEISTFRYLRYEYHNPADNSAIAIFRDPESAQRALEASPLRFALEKPLPDDGYTEQPQETVEASEEVAMSPPPPPKSGIDELVRASQLLGRHSSKPSAPTTSSPTTPQAPQSTTADIPFHTPSSPKPASEKWFDLSLDRSRVVHQDFVERQHYWTKFTPMKSMAQEDLAKVVPHVGLSDVSKRGQPRTPNKVLKWMAGNVQRMKTLREMYE